MPAVVGWGFIMPEMICRELLLRYNLMESECHWGLPKTTGKCNMGGRRSPDWNQEWKLLSLAMSL